MKPLGLPNKPRPNHRSSAKQTINCGHSDEQADPTPYIRQARAALTDEPKMEYPFNKLWRAAPFPTVLPRLLLPDFDF